MITYAGVLCPHNHRGLDWLPACFMGSSRGLGWDGSGERLRQSPSTNGGQKLVKSTGHPQHLCWSLVSLVVKAAAFVCRAGHWKPRSLLHGCYWQPLLFLLIPVHLCISQLCHWSQVKSMWGLHAVPWKAREAHSFFQGRKTHFSWEVHPWFWAIPALDDADKMKLSSFPFCAVLRFLVPLCF